MLTSKRNITLITSRLEYLLAVLRQLSEANFRMVNLTELTKVGGINTCLSNIKTVQKYKRWDYLCLIEGYF